MFSNTFYHGYHDNNVTGSQTFDNNNDTQYFIFTTGIAFSKKLFHNIEIQIEIGVVSFEAAAEIYDSTVGTKEKHINANRLEAAWFVYKVTS